MLIRQNDQFLIHVVTLPTSIAANYLLVVNISCTWLGVRSSVWRIEHISPRLVRVLSDLNDIIVPDGAVSNLEQPASDAALSAAVAQFFPK